MSAVEHAVSDPGVALRLHARPRDSFISRFLELISSVRFGVFLIVLLGLACLIGMLIMQQNVDGFANYYHQLTPAQRVVYGRLKFFDIYHAWYFNALLALLSTNIILASIDRFPKTWRFVSKPNVVVPVRWMLDQEASGSFELEGNRSVAGRFLSRKFKEAGFRKTVATEKNGLAYIFAQKGVWNRLGAYAVHVALLTIFAGGLLTAQVATNGQLSLAPGMSSNQITQTVVNLDRVSQLTMQLPFEVSFTDIEQTLIRKDGPITAGNTIDWITRFTIKDESGLHEGEARMNRPFDHRGYRFFQASFIPVGRARSITVRATDGAGISEEVVIPRGGGTTLKDGTRIDLAEFRGNFRIGPEDPNEDTTDYPNPAAVLKVTQNNGASETAYAFGQQMAEMPAVKITAAGYSFRLLDFEKVSDRHNLSVQRDPGANVVYAGFLMLFMTLMGVFFFSHQRVWAAIEETREGDCRVLVAGNSNRNQNAFAEKLAVLIDRLKRASKESETG